MVNFFLIGNFQKAPDNIDLLLKYHDYFNIYHFLDYIPESLAEFENEINANGSDRHPTRLMKMFNLLRGHNRHLARLTVVVKELREKVVDELIPKVKLDFDMFGDWKKCR
jgi:hypothetical protein